MKNNIKMNIELTKEQYEQEKKGKMTNFYEIPIIKESIENKVEKIKHIKDVVVEQEIIDDCKKKLKKYKTKKGETLKIVNIEKINKLWKKDIKHYVSEIYEEIKYPLQYLKSRDNLLKKMIYEPPKIVYNEEKDLIEITNGRHRFSNLRDLGCKEIPVIVIDNETIKKIEELEKII